MSPSGGSAKSVTRGSLRRARRQAAAAGTTGQALAERAAAALVASRRPVFLPGRALPAGPLRVAAYLSLPGEPPTGPLRRRLQGLGHTVLLPYLQADLDLDWVHDLDRGPERAVDPSDPGTDPLRPGGPRLGVQAVAGCDLVLVPALAVDRDGARLGQGGGSYDRALTRVARSAGRAVLVAVVHEGEVLPAGSWPVEEHDVPVDAALTPAGLVPLGASGPGDARPA